MSKDLMNRAFLKAAKARIAQRHLTQKKTAEMLQLSQGSISLKLNGRVALTGADVFNLAAHLQIPIDRITGVRPPMRSEATVKTNVRKAIIILDEIFEAGKMPYSHYEKLYEAIAAICGGEEKLHDKRSK